MSNVIQTYNASEVLEYYSKNVSASYTRVARAYLRFCHEQSKQINEMSYNAYILGKSGSMVSMAKKFYKYLNDNGMLSINYDMADKAIPQNRYIILFLEGYDGIASEDTKSTYLQALNSYSKYCELNSLPFISDISVKKYRDSLAAEGKSPKTVNTYLYSIHSMAKYLTANKVKLKADAETVESLRSMAEVRGLKSNDQNGYTKESLTAEEREMLIMNIPRLRDKLVLSLMAYEGLRSIEVTKLTFADFELSTADKDGTLAVDGKGVHNKVKVRLFETSERLFNLFLDTRDKELLSDKLLFPEVTRSMVAKIAKAEYKRAGIERDGLTAHSLRHTACQCLHYMGVPEEVIKMQARHKSSSTTQLYTQRALNITFMNSLPKNLFK